MKLDELLRGQPENHLLPFLWVHGGGRVHLSPDDPRH